MKLILCIHVYDISLCINCVFYSGQITTLVAMETCSFHRLMMGKVEMDIFLSQWGYLDFYFSGMLIE